MFESEEDKIAEIIKDFIKNSKEHPEDVYIMLKNGRIIDIENYSDMVRRSKINPQDGYVYIRTRLTIHKSDFYYPFLAWYEDLLRAYLSKLGFRSALVTDLRYVASAISLRYNYIGYLSIEVVNLDTAVNNTNLRKIMFEVLGEKLISGEKKLTGEEYSKIYNMFGSQKLFAGYGFFEAWCKIYNYYDGGNKSLIKEAARIAMDYARIFQPYTVCYDEETWREVDCWSIKLD